MSRKYNRNKYNIFKKINKKVREEIRPNSFVSLEEIGKVGKIGSWLGNKIIKKPMHKLNRNLVGLYYNPKVDSPVKGSVLYTLFDFLTYGSLFIIIVFMVSLIV